MSKKLLLADDSITIQKVIGITFANEDYDLEIVDNGDAALEKARALRPDLILADVFMPGRNGYELCAAIKQDNALRHIPVLLLTGTFEPFDEAKARASGADSWIAKPFESQALIERVEQLLASPPAPAAAPAAEEPVFAAGEPVPEATEWAAEPLPDLAGFELVDAEPAVAPDLGMAPAPAVEPEPAAAEDDIWGAISFDEVDLAEMPLEEEAAEDIWGTLDEIAAPAPAAVAEPAAAGPVPAVESFFFEEEVAPAEEAPSAAAAEEFLFEEEATPAWPTGDEEPFPLDEVEILEEEEVAMASAGGGVEFEFEEAFAPGPPAVEEPLVAAASDAWEVVGEAPVMPAAAPVAEPFGPEEEPPSWEEPAAAIEPAAAEELFALEEEPFRWEEPPAAEPAAAAVPESPFITAAEAAAEFPSPVAPPVEERVAAISEEQLQQIVERVAGSVIERLAGTILEKLAWEVVPDLAESLIREEIRKIREGAQ
jgi:CheY-like chemotaxis protein